MKNPLALNYVEVPIPGELKEVITKPVWCVEDIASQLAHYDKAFCERYGGFGLGGHGGGARSINIGPYQIKGVGLTPLCGKVNNGNYSHGTLTLEEAFYETIYSELFRNILPAGAAKIFGIFYTGENSAYKYNWQLNNPLVEKEVKKLTKTHGAVLIREICERPAHYIRAGGFEVKNKYKDILCSDVERIRRVVNALSRKFPSQEDIQTYFYKFAETSANQLAFCRIAGIVHSALSPSNICTDGSWLDLSSATFLDRGREFIIGNYSYSSEPGVIKVILLEFMYTFEKYSKRRLNHEALIDFYENKLKFDTLYHFPYIIGTDRKLANEKVKAEKINDLYEQFKKIIFPSGKEYGLDDIGETKGRPVCGLIKEVLTKKPCLLFDLYNPLYSSEQRNFSFSSFIKRALIKSVKRDVLSSLFYRNRMAQRISGSNRSNDRILAFGDIQLYLKSMKWIFDDQYTEKEIVFMWNGYELFFDLKADCFFFQNEQIASSDLSIIVESRMCEDILDKEVFWEYFKELSGIIECAEKIGI